MLQIYLENLSTLNWQCKVRNSFLVIFILKSCTYNGLGNTFVYPIQHGKVLKSFSLDLIYDFKLSFQLL